MERKRRKIYFSGGEEKGEGKGGKYLAKKNMIFTEEKKNGEGKGGNTTTTTNNRTRKDRATQPMDHRRLR